jgi:dolichol-phosphate mannosyltransferase
MYPRMSQSPCETRLPVAVVIPCYKAKRHIAEVLAGLAGRVRHIYVVDDCCSEQTGRFVQEIGKDANVSVVFLTENQGVGGAVLAGYRQALKDGHEIVVKMDGDNQMDPAYLPALVAPLVQGEADYAKGNRFFDVYSLGAMPTVRLLGNASLSFIVKMASGYWDIMDPTNGYTAIHCVALRRLPLDRLDRRYFFECDMLFRLATIRAVVRDVPMPARYEDEISNLKVSGVLFQFPWRLLSCILKRFFYIYILRDFNIGSVETIFGIILLAFGAIFGVWNWVSSAVSGQFASTGTIMLAVLPFVIGTQLLLSAVGYDIANRPANPLARDVSTLLRFPARQCAEESGIRASDL